MAAACNSPADETEKDAPVGTYGFDLDFLKEQGVEVLELLSKDSNRRVLLTPTWQGRVMTSSSRGLTGKSNGWINYDLISSDKLNPQFNPFGGEERLWLGPEGGPFSLYFQEVKKQVYENWKVPAFIDTQAFETRSSSRNAATFSGQAMLKNASGNRLEIDVVREVKLLNASEIASSLEMELPQGLEFVAYRSVNRVKNIGDTAWTPDYGFVSIWMLCMFNPSQEGIVVLPVDAEGKSRQEILTDNYFGKIPDDRLRLRDGVVYFKVDGKKRSKIGIAPAAARPIAAGYDPTNQKLTVVTYSGPYPDAPYVNSVWGAQDNPLEGDVINSYNDGPVDGNIMGPFYEIETSSPAALLAPGEEITHTQGVYHFQGKPEDLEKITSKLLGTKLTEIIGAFGESGASH